MKELYETLEEEIDRLWGKRGLEVLEETFESVGEDKFKWTITARKIKCCRCGNTDKLYLLKDVVGGDDWNYWCDKCLKELLKPLGKRRS